MCKDLILVYFAGEYQVAVVNFETDSVINWTITKFPWVSGGNRKDDSGRFPDGISRIGKRYGWVPFGFNVINRYKE